jgi:glycosyltransferase involved in cell wall biosynthesis
MAPALQVSVVIPTRDRGVQIVRQLAALRSQTMARERFEVIVVDDGSEAGTAELLAAEERAGDLPLRVIRHRSPGGPARARNAGWGAARGALIAFTDDDCVADPRWLEAGLRAWAGDPEAFVQGTTAPEDAELARRDPFAYSVEVTGLTPESETCNIFYPRALLERLGGFDAEAFDGPQGEDTDLAWRARAAGARPVFAADARMEHAVMRVGPAGILRRAWRWTPAILPFARHPELRRARLINGVFWNWTHYLLFRALLGLPFARRRWGWPLAWWLGRRLVAYELEKGRRQGTRALAVFWLAHDVVEVAAVLRGAIRYRTLVI